jgi:hypothetical protein
MSSVLFLDEGAPTAGRPSSIPTRSAHVTFETSTDCNTALTTDTSTSVQPFTVASTPTGLSSN